VERGSLEDTDHAEGDTAVAAAAAVRRVLLAPYVQSLTRLPADLVLSLGARFDAFHLRFDQTAGGAGRSRRDLSRWSPRTALAWKRRRAEVWLAGSGVFKIPTLDQLYDLRHPFGLPLSNPDLQPQHGTSVEIGLRLEPRPTTRADVTLYRIRMRDEISFDAARFVYANVGRSDHDGAEIGVAHRWSGRLETAASYTWTDAVFRSGSVNGNRVHGIPEHRGRLDLQLALPLRLGLALTLEANGAQPLDEANTRELRGFATTSARLRRAFRHLDAWVQVDDLFDARHAASGYVLPFDGAELLYPAGARRFALGLELRR
jgi:iron complex outermembrane receptor protein